MVLIVYTVIFNVSKRFSNKLLLLLENNKKKNIWLKYIFCQNTNFASKTHLIEFPILYS